MTALDPGAAADRAHEIQLDHELGITTGQFRHPGPTWICNREGCGRTAACKPAGCANDLIDRREFRAQYRGYTITDVDFADGWDE
ncbi:hypothetical protein M1M07_23805 [Rhodococcus sp. HM1]|uniref:hypothetical protein n=1 Tax=Rhodococcus sp. HM1 TaxID=2937759 RepID=UPI00200ABBD9|nr:hypothetical protein [Rhodococcus sp. HM1]MCK8674123.1 hypothetical protein [Rhodococcus sp. HM1]